MSIFYVTFETPLGRVIAAAEKDRVIALAFTDGRYAPVPVPDWTERPDDPLLDSVVRQIGEYLSGKRRCFTFPVSLAGTPFQMRVWGALQEIPYGKTVSYREVTRFAGLDDRFIRPVASAISRNTVMLAIPCHRVIGSDGTLVGYAGGLDRKKALLDMERTTLDKP